MTNTTTVASLKKQLGIQTSTLITAPSTRQLLTQQPQPTTTLTLPRLTTATPPVSASTKQKLLAHSALQQAHNQQCLYRACATLTTFRAQDPDPHAVDGGAILGIRVEVTSRARFLRPYYVLLNRPYAGGSRHVRVHRHTLPACIPLGGLAGRHLPAPPGKAGSGGAAGKRQDLARFARALRREVVRYHHRLGVVADLRKAAGVGDEAAPLVDIAPADAEAKQLTIEWADGRTGRLVMGDDGEIVKLVVLGENGRDREAGRDLLGGAVRVEDVVKRLAALS
jgi:central kinetochore subunit Mal2/MCM21